MAQTRTRTRTGIFSKELHLRFAMVYLWAAGLIVLLALAAGIITNLSTPSGDTGPGGVLPLTGSINQALPIATLSSAGVQLGLVTPALPLTVHHSNPLEIPQL